MNRNFNDIAFLILGESVVPILVGMILFLIAFICIVYFTFGPIFFAWLEGARNQVGLSLMECVSVKMLKGDPKEFVKALVLAKQYSLYESDPSLTKKNLVKQMASGGDPLKVIEQIVENKRVNQMPQTFEELGQLQVEGKAPFDR